ncbi:MAG: NAD-dependent epimerase/dehydratase family protein, partial [Candidatus Korarchaeum sp.]|nr:NAD-dependent epimerase/dehydratase family protein [Candidatus Korarchaeum sp.]
MRSSPRYTFNLLEAVRRCDVREIVFASSSSVYSKPYEELHTCKRR